MKTRSLFSAALLMFLAFATARAESVFRDFVTVRGDQLFEGEKPYRFISWNVPNQIGRAHV